MRRNLEHRLRALEVVGSGHLVICTEKGDGTFCGPHGERTTWEEAQALWRATGRVPILLRKVDAGL